VRQTVHIQGQGFAPNREFDVALDGVDFGQSNTSSAGGFSTSLIPGGLTFGVSQHVYHLDATDGTTGAGAAFTVTRRAGGRFLATRGNPHTLRAPFEIWGFALNGDSHTVYAHYVGPSGGLRTTVTLGQTGGQCGYLRTRRRSLFPFSAGSGSWTLQLDTSRSYSRHPAGPVARIGVTIG
jgi:hypothetical protein